MDQERRSQREMMQENEKQARTTYTNAQAKAAMSRRDLVHPLDNSFSSQ